MRRHPLRLVAVIGPLLVLAITALGACDDAALNELGAPGALQETVEVRLGDFWLAPAAGEPVEAGGFFGRVRPHNDVTFRVVNEGGVSHALTLYATGDAADILVATPLIEPGQAVELRFHFHDATTVLLRDDGYPELMSARLEIIEG